MSSPPSPAPSPARIPEAAPAHAPALAPSRQPSRIVHHADAVSWLRGARPLTGASVVTSLPDVSELPALDLPAWCTWFEDAVSATALSVPDDGVAIFFQSDIKRDGLWIDKGLMVARAAEKTGLGLLFHKIVCRKPPGTVTYGRSSYSHLLAFARVLRPPLGRATPDILPDAGFMPGNKAMGVKACVDACRFVLAETSTRIIVDPFCGWGTVLAVANALGMDSVGVDLSTRMCRRARTLQIDLGSNHG